MRSKNLALSMIFNRCRSNLSSTTGQYISYLMAKHKVDFLEDLVKENSSIKKSRVYTIGVGDTSWKHHRMVDNPEFRT